MRFYYCNCMGDCGYFSEKCIVKAIYTAWNIEAELYIVRGDGTELIFAPHDGNEFNSELLEDYGYKMVDGEKEREIVDIITGDVVKYKWKDVRRLI